MSCSAGPLHCRRRQKSWVGLAIRLYCSTFDTGCSGLGKTAIMPEFFQHHWGDLASVMGLVVTIVTLLKVRSVAAATKAAAEETKNRLSQIDTLSDISAAITMMDEIKRLHRTKGWNVLLERYAT